MTVSQTEDIRQTCGLSPPRWNKTVSHSTTEVMPSCNERERNPKRTLICWEASDSRRGYCLLIGAQVTGSGEGKRAVSLSPIHRGTDYELNGFRQHIWDKTQTILPMASLTEGLCVGRGEGGGILPFAERGPTLKPRWCLFRMKRCLESH